MPSVSDHLSTTLAALSDPTRRAILARLAAGQATVTELAAPFDMSMPAVSRHLKVLEHAGLITRGREAQWRPCRITAAPLKDVSDWVEHYRATWEEYLAHYKRFWTESLDRLDEYLKDVQKKEKKHGHGKLRAKRRA